jgi:hypothetical protein
MTIGNLFLKIRQMPSMHIIVMVALLLVGMKNCNHPEQRLDEQRQTNREALNEVLHWFSSFSLLNRIPALRAGIERFSEQMVTSNVENRLYEHT